MKDERQQLTVRLDSPHLSQAKQFATEERRPLAQMVRVLLEEAIEARTARGQGQPTVKP